MTSEHERSGERSLELVVNDQLRDVDITHFFTDDLDLLLGFNGEKVLPNSITYQGRKYHHFRMIKHNRPYEAIEGYSNVFKNGFPYILAEYIVEPKNDVTERCEDINDLKKLLLIFTNPNGIAKAETKVWIYSYNIYKSNIQAYLDYIYSTMPKVSDKAIKEESNLTGVTAHPIFSFFRPLLENNCCDATMVPEGELAYDFINDCVPVRMLFLRTLPYLYTVEDGLEVLDLDNLEKGLADMDLEKEGGYPIKKPLQHFIPDYYTMMYYLSLTEEDKKGGIIEYFNCKKPISYRSHNTSLTDVRTFREVDDRGEDYSNVEDLTGKHQDVLITDIMFTSYKNIPNLKTLTYPDGSLGCQADTLVPVLNILNSIPNGSSFFKYLKHRVDKELFPVIQKVNGVYLLGDLILCPNVSGKSFKVKYTKDTSVIKGKKIDDYDTHIVTDIGLYKFRLLYTGEALNVMPNHIKDYTTEKLSNTLEDAYGITLFKYIEQRTTTFDPRSVRLMKAYTLFIDATELRSILDGERTILDLLIGPVTSELKVPEPRPVIFWGLDSPMNCERSYTLFDDSLDLKKVCKYNLAYDNAGSVEFSNVLRDQWVMEDLINSILQNQ